MYDFDIVKFPSPVLHISQLIQFARASGQFYIFNIRYKILPAKFLKQEYQYHRRSAHYANTHVRNIRKNLFYNKVALA